MNYIGRLQIMQGPKFLLKTFCYHNFYNSWLLFLVYCAKTVGNIYNYYVHLIITQNLGAFVFT